MIHLDKWLEYNDSYSNHSRLAINPNSIERISCVNDYGGLYCYIFTTSNAYCFKFDRDEFGESERKTLYNYVVSVLDKGFYLDIKK